MSKNGLRCHRNLSKGAEDQEALGKVVLVVLEKMVREPIFLNSLTS